MERNCFGPARFCSSFHPFIYCKSVVGYFLRNLFVVIFMPSGRQRLIGFRSLNVFLETPANQTVASQTLRNAFQIVLYCCEIYHSLIFQELPQVFVDEIAGWMQKFQELLNYDNPDLRSDVSLISFQVISFVK